jgi:hypothetical protein
VIAHPLAAWAEEAFGIASENGRLIRRSPETFENAVRRLTAESDVSEVRSREKLRAVLDAGNRTLLDGQPVFAFRLHQFLSSGGSVYATIEAPEARVLTMEAQYRADDERLLYPLAFCRECGQEYCLVTRVEEDGRQRLQPRPTMVGAPEDDFEGEGGFFILDDSNLWSGDIDELPESWFDELTGGRRVKKPYENHIPHKLGVTPDGFATEEPNAAGVRGWFQARPLLLCLRCWAIYDLRAKDYKKLSSLSQTGRSTATTVVSNAAVAGMREQGIDTEECKLLSFTDNRQDASLQAGHLNDFVQVAQLRAAIVSSMEQRGELQYDELGPAIFDAMELRPEDFLKNPVKGGPGYQQGREAMIGLLEYRTLEDLTRGWRVNQPNLEQTGLLRIDYAGLEELAADDSLWRGLPAIADAQPTLRQSVLRATQSLTAEPKSARMRAKGGTE